MAILRQCREESLGMRIMASSHSKKLINDPSNVVDEALEGLVAANNGLKLLRGHRVIIRADVEDVVKAGKVAVVSGGGSGHEPSHAGFVGRGMLTAAVAGAIFASPPTKSILVAIRAVGRGNAGGVLLIVKNYTGDRLNFGFAAERAKAEGIKVDMVVVGEDCALTSQDKTAGRRGLCGTVLIHKIAGTLAEEGQSLDEIVSTAKSAAQNMGTIGISLSPCSIPGSKPSFILSADEMELGLGIHGEPGVERIKMEPADVVVKRMLSHMSDVNSAGSTYKLPLKQGDNVALVINNLGGTSVLELNVVTRAALNYLVKEKAVTVQRLLVGSFMTSLEMAGVSLTVMHLDEVRRHCLDSPTSATAWPAQLHQVASTDSIYKEYDGPKESDLEKVVPQKLNNEGEKLFSVISGVLEALIAAESKLNDLDNVAGDGDCGTTMARGAVAVKTALGSRDAPGLPCNSPHDALVAVANVCEDDMGGSSGVFYSLFFMSGAVLLVDQSSAKDWALAMEAGVSAIMRYGGAEPGDRTMLDSLHPACLTLRAELDAGKASMEAFKLAVEAAERGAEATINMAARAGRSSYVSQTHLTCPDPGAVAAAIWLRAAYEALK